MVGAVLKLKNEIVCIFLLSQGLGAVAMSLGELRGAAWLGQTLDLRVAVMLDEPLGVETQCLDAEVIYGDLQQAPGRVRLSVEPASQVGSATIRIQSLNPVNEPVVTVNLKAGCTAKTARRYVVFADPPSSVAGNNSGVSEALLALPVRVDSVGLTGEKTNSMAKTVSTSSQKRSKTSVVFSQVDRPLKSLERRIANPPTRKSRLSLDPLEPLELRFDRTQQERPLQAASTQLAVLHPDEPTQGLMPNQDLQRLKKLETDVRSMQAQVVKGEQGMSQLRDRLKQAESERYDNGLVYALLALLMGVLAYLAYLLRRQTQAESMISDAWFESVQAVSAQPVSAIVPKPEATSQPSAVIVDSIVEGSRLQDVDLEDLLVKSDSRSIVSAPVEGEYEIHKLSKNKFHFNKPGVKTDPRQHAEFLVSLGQSDQAIQILDSAIHDDEKTNPMVYLDLLKIYHAMGMRDDYRYLSEKFSHLFKARVPDYAGFRKEGRDLTTYEEALTQISFYWSSPEVVEVINSYIYTDINTPTGDVFDLQAFRELLLLRAVALNKLEEPPAQWQSGREMNSVIWQS